MDKIFEDRLFEAQRSWDEGNHSEDNLWAKWKIEQAEKVKETCCGTFEWWDSLPPANSTASKIVRMVKWAELVLWHSRLNTGSNSRYTIVKSHLRRI
jgi:hypothetical protein